MLELLHATPSETYRSRMQEASGQVTKGQFLSCILMMYKMGTLEVYWIISYSGWMQAHPMRIISVSATVKAYGWAYYSVFTTWAKKEENLFPWTWRFGVYLATLLLGIALMCEAGADLDRMVPPRSSNGSPANMWTYSTKLSPVSFPNKKQLGRKPRSSSPKHLSQLVNYPTPTHHANTRKWTTQIELRICSLPACDCHRLPLALSWAY